MSQNNDAQQSPGTILDYDRDWDEIKEKYLSSIPEQQRDDLLELIVRMAVYN